MTIPLCQCGKPALISDEMIGDELFDRFPLLADKPICQGCIERALYRADIAAIAEIDLAALQRMAEIHRD